MRPPYLTGERLYLRVMLAADKEVAVAWHGGPFPINAGRAETVLQESHREPGWRRNRWLFGVVRSEDDAMIGSLSISFRDRRRAELAAQLSPWLPDADGWRADVLRLAVPWLRDEGEMMTVTVEIDSDQPVTLATAAALGMVQAARLRERVARPGGRIDQFLYQRLNPRWEVRTDA